MGHSTVSSQMRTTSAWLYGSGLLAVILIAVGGGFLALSDYFDRGELGTKDYYATLQALEFDNRDNKDPSPILKKNVNGSGLDVLGVRGGDADRTRVWVVLNRTSPDGRPLMIPLNLSIGTDCASILGAVSGKQVVDAAKQYLLNHCDQHPEVR